MCSGESRISLSQVKLNSTQVAVVYVNNTVRKIRSNKMLLAKNEETYMASLRTFNQSFEKYILHINMVYASV